MFISNPHVSDTNLHFWREKFELAHSRGFTQRWGAGGLSFQDFDGGMGHWTINYTGTQSFITILSYLLFQKL